LQDKPQYITKIYDFSSSGWGVGRKADYRVSLIRGAVIGDTVEFTVLTDSHTLTNGIVSKIIEPSPDRIKHPCVHYDDGCAGSLLGSYDYHKGIEWKRNNLREVLRRIGKIENPNIEDIITGERIWGYRNRIELQIFRTEDVVDMGYKSDRKQLPICDCLLAMNSIRQVLPSLKKALATIKPKPSGLSGRMLLRDNGHGQCVGVLFIARQQEKEWRLWIGGLKELFAGWQMRTMFSLDHRFTDSVLVDSAGDAAIYRDISGKEIMIDTMCFSQTNDEIEVKMRELVLKELSPDGRLLELYGGYGHIGLAFGFEHNLKRYPIKPAVEKPPNNDAPGEENRTVVEEAVKIFITDVNKEAIKIARRYINKYNLSGGSAPLDAAVAARRFLLQDTPQYVIADPPRSGLSREVIRCLNEVKVKKLIYISCHPAVLARDLDLLKEYEPKRFIPFDMFPQTAEMETVCILERR